MVAILEDWLTRASRSTRQAAHLMPIVRLQMMRSRISNSCGARCPCYCLGSSPRWQLPICRFQRPFIAGSGSLSESLKTQSHFGPGQSFSNGVSFSCLCTGINVGLGPALWSLR